MSVLLGGEALAFNAAADHIEVINNPDFGGATEMTLEAWVYAIDIASTPRTIFSKWSPIQYSLVINSGILEFALLTANGGVVVYSGQSIPSDQWVHLSATYDGSVMRVLVNGEVVGEAAQTGAIVSSASPLFIGLDSNMPTGSFKGRMDNIRIWTRALSDCELQLVLAAEGVLNTDGLQAHYTLNHGIAFDDNAGITNAQDATGNGFDGQLVNFSLTGSLSNWIAPGQVLPGSFTGAFTYQHWYLDADGDGYTSQDLFQCTDPGIGWILTPGIGLADDCDDSDPTVWMEVGAWYDADGDGYNSTNQMICIGNTYPPNYSANTLGLDCDDNNASVYQYETWYLDADNDGHYESIQPSCGSPGPGYTLTQGLYFDCDDSDPLVWEDLAAYIDNDNDGRTVGSLVFLCTNGQLPAGYRSNSLGEDCNDNDPSSWQFMSAYVDADGDGYASSMLVNLCTNGSLPAGYVLPSAPSDCNDDNALQSIPFQPAISYSASPGMNICPGNEIVFTAQYSGYGGSPLVLWVINGELGPAGDVFASTTLLDGDEIFAVLYSEDVCMPEATFSSPGIVHVASEVNWYLDADNDGFYTSVFSGCISPGAGWTTNLPTGGSGDCQDSDASVHPGAPELCANSVDDDCDIAIDEGCPVFVPGDSPAASITTAYSSNMNYPNCYPVSGNLQFAGNSPESAEFNGPDVWYRFVAYSAAVSVTLTSSSMDDAIALYSKSGESYILLASENAGAGVGDFERLNYSGLTPGSTYYISAGAVSGPGGAYQICIQHLMPSGCATSVPAAGLALCSNFKAIFRGSPASGVTYNFTFTGIGGGASGSTSVNGTNGLIVLSNPNLALRYGGEYSAQVDVNYALLNGGGGTDNITVFGASTANCSNVDIITQPLYEVRSSQRCPSILFRSNYLIGVPVAGSFNACGATGFTYELTQVTSCGDASIVSLAVEYNRPANSPFLNLGVLPQLSNNGAWSVRIRPNFSYGDGVYGPAQLISVNNTAAMADLDNLQAPVDAEKQIAANTGFSIYPNPSIGGVFAVYLSDDWSEELELTILDNLGKIVYDGRISEDVGKAAVIAFRETLSPGMYFVIVRNAHQQVVERVMVN